MKSSRVALTALVLAAATALSGCETGQSILDWLDLASAKTKIQGERIAIIAPDQELEADPQIAMEKMTLPPPKKNADWALPGGTADNMVGNLLTDGPLKQVWSTDTGKGSDGDSELTAPPIVAGGLIYVLDAAAHVYAFDALTGKPAWDKSLAPPGGSSGFFFGVFGADHSITPSTGAGGGLAYDDGKLFAATGFANVIAMDARTGKQLWTANTTVPVHSAPVVVDGRVFIITQENQTQALDEKDGHLLWDHRGTVESAEINSSASVAVENDTVVVPYSSGELFALRTQNGTPSWNDTLSRTGNVTALTIINDIAGRPVIDGNMVFAVSHSGTLAAINFRSGSRAWTRNIAGIQTPLVAGNYVFVVSTEGLVVCLTRADGRVRWTTQLPAFTDPVAKSGPIVWTGPLLVSNLLVLVGSNGKADLLSPYNGQKLGETDMPDGTFIPPVVANGMMYLLTNDAQLVALR
jgi:outer membrane protein assembly factor BamB